MWIACSNVGPSNFQCSEGGYPQVQDVWANQGARRSRPQAKAPSFVKRLPLPLGGLRKLVRNEELERAPCEGGGVEHEAKGRSRSLTAGLAPRN